MNIGIIGSGNIGSTLAKLCVATGNQVAIANSRGPQTLATLVNELGPSAHAAIAEDAANFGAVVVVAIPFGKIESLPLAAFSGKIVIDANNYYPDRDGHSPGLDNDNITSSEILASLLPGARVVKAFNTIQAGQLATQGNTSLPEDQRRAIFISGDDADAKHAVSALIHELGFGVVDLGSLAVGGRRQQPGTPIYSKELTVREAKDVVGARLAVAA